MGYVLDDGTVFKLQSETCELTLGQAVMLTAHLHLAPGLRMDGAVPLQPPYAFTMWTWQT